MKYIFALLIASSAFIALNAQQREITWGQIQRDSVVRATERFQGNAASNQTITVDREITGIRSSDLSAQGTSNVILVSGLNTNVAVFSISPTILGQSFDVRVTVFSGSSIIHASAIIMVITLLFSYLMK